MTTDLQTTPYTADQALREAARTGTIGEPIRTWRSGAILVPVTVPGRWHGNIRCTPSQLQAARDGAATDTIAELHATRAALAEMVAAYGTGSYGTRRQEKAIAKARKALGA